MAGAPGTADFRHAEDHGGDQLDVHVLERRLQLTWEQWLDAFPEIVAMAHPEGKPKLFLRRYEEGMQFLGLWAGDVMPTREQILRPKPPIICVASWWSDATIGFSNVAAWPWRTTLGLLRNLIRTAVEILAKQYPAPELRAEHLWAVSRLMLPQDSRDKRLRDPGSRKQAVLKQVEEHIEHLIVDKPQRSFVNGRELIASELNELRDYLRDLPDEKFGDPWPMPVRHGMNDDAAGLAVRAEAVYDAAFQAYAGLVTRWFPRAASTMELAVLLPLRMHGYVDVDRTTTPGISMELWPLPEGSANQFELITSSAPPQPWEETKARYRRFASDLDHLRPEGAAWVHTFGGSYSLWLYGARPATELVFKWLWNDLHDLHLADGFAPRLEY